MKDAGLVLRTKVFERLNTAITYNNRVVPVYDSAAVPANAETPYIVLGTFTSTEQGEGSKQSYGQECFLNIEVIVNFANAYGGKKACDTITNEVSELIRTRQAGYLDLSPDWSVITTTLDNTLTLETLLTDGMEVRRINRYKFNIYEQ
jgi:hypothetical protein